MMPAWVLVCVPAAVVVGAAGYIAADRAVLREIGLEMARGGVLAEVRHHLPRALGGQPRIRQGGPVCHWELDSADIGPAPLYARSFGQPVPVYGGLGTTAFGGFGSPLDSRDFAALVPVPGVSVVPIGGPLAVLPGNPETVVQPVSVPEPSSIAILAVGLAGLAMVRRWL